MSPDGDLTGRVALVTGAASGIGRAIALHLASRGASVAVADLDLAGARQTVALGPNDRSAAFQVDVTDADQIKSLREAVEGQLGQVDVIVNNAGWSKAEPFMSSTRELWDKLAAVNFMGPVCVSREFLGPLVEGQRGGTVVNVASDAGRVGSSGETVYAGAKGGIIAFTKSLAREVARYGITANCVSPGPTDTPLFRSQPEKLQQALIRAVPLRRLAAPEDVAAAVGFFASPAASYVTGQVLSVSGGLTMVG